MSFGYLQVTDTFPDGIDEPDSVDSSHSFTPKCWFEPARHSSSRLLDLGTPPVPLPSVDDSSRHGSRYYSRRSIVERDSDGGLRLASHVLEIRARDIFNEREPEPSSSRVQRHLSYFVET
jgi:hypothetical protein